MTQTRGTPMIDNFYKFRRKVANLSDLMIKVESMEIVVDES
jgi:hypothetical protein